MEDDTPMLNRTVPNKVRKVLTLYFDDQAVAVIATDNQQGISCTCDNFKRQRECSHITYAVDYLAPKEKNHVDFRNKPDWH
jgi:hypothetical protein